MNLRLKSRAALSGAAAIALVLVTATSASAWGGPTNFSYSGSSCSKYSIAVNAQGNAGASTALLSGPGQVKVGFRNSGHTFISPVSGAGTAVTFVNQTIVTGSGIVGASHQCGDAQINTSSPVVTSNT